MIPIIEIILENIDVDDFENKLNPLYKKYRLVKLLLKI